MLILTRNYGQSIMIGDDIEIKVLNSSHNQVRIGIDAPLEVNIVREELHNKKTRKILSRNLSKNLEVTD